MAAAKASAASARISATTHSNQIHHHLDLILGRSPIANHGDFDFRGSYTQRPHI